MAWNQNGYAGIFHQYIKMREVEADGVTFPEGSEEINLLVGGWPVPPEWGVYEAPWIVYREPYYYLFFSTSLFFTSYYNVAVARSTNVTGPYERRPDQYVLIVDQDRLKKGTVKFVGTGV